MCCSAMTHCVGMMRVQTVEVLSCTSYSLSKGSHQLCLLNILGFQGFGFILPK